MLIKSAVGSQQSIVLIHGTIGFIHDLDFLKKLKINGFPTTLVITNGKMIVFRGDIERLDNFLLSQRQ